MNNNQQKNNGFNVTLNGLITQAPQLAPVTVTFESIKQAIEQNRKKQLLEMALFLEQKGISGITKVIEERGIPEVIFAETGIYYFIRAAFTPIGIEVKENRYMKRGTFAFTWDKNLSDFVVKVELQ